MASDTAALAAPVSTGPTRDQIEALSSALDEPRWLLEHRLRALAAYAALDWPTGQEEEWRRTPMADVPLEEYRLVIRGDTPADRDRFGFAASEHAGLVAHVDDAVTAVELDAELAERGVVLLPLSVAAREHETLVRGHLNSIIPLNTSRFTALSGALWSQGLFCYIPRNVRVEKTLYHALSKTASGQGLFGQTLIVAEQSSALTLVEAAFSEDAAGASLVHRTIEIAALENAQVRVVELQRWGTDVYAFSTQRVRLGRSANVLLASATFGGALSKETIDAEISGAGSNAELIGMFVGSRQQHIEFITRQEHSAPGATSDLVIKGALTEDAHAVQYGVITISPGGQQCNAQQTLRNLLLSDGASADPIPVLEIEADDVKCAHAAAVGPVDAEHLFYLQSRGIPADVAERMVVRGFLDIVAERLPDAHIRNVVESLIEEKLSAVQSAAPTNGATA